jgi:acetate kinase
MNILVLNAGSSSLKFQLIDARSTGAMSVVAKGSVDRIGEPKASFHITTDNGLPNASEISSIHEAVERIIRSFADTSIDAIGYRIVHGGDRFEQPARITPDAIIAITSLTGLAPLHNAGALQCIEAAQHLLPHIPGVAVFDTSFHRTMPEAARRYAIPRQLADQHHLHRFGFHGISHQYVSKQLLRCMNQPVKGSRLITCHLGNGASVCAIRDGKSIDTSMGLTPLEGLIMGTRSGDVDPGLILYLIRVLKMSADDIDDLLNHRSGLLGLSELSGDVRDLEVAASKGNVLAEAALDAFAYRCRKYIGAYAAVLGGVDGIAFAGGVGEHSPNIRARIARGLEFLGIELDQQRNSEATGDSSASIGSGKARLWVIPTNEEQEVAEQVLNLLAKKRVGPS